MAVSRARVHARAIVVTPAGQQDVISRLQARKGSRTLQVVADEIARVTSETISIQHLSNILKGRKKPSVSVLRYLGMTATVTYA